MSADPAKLLEEALSLPAEARAALAGSLLDSLDKVIDPDAEAAWEIEIARRLAEIDARKVVMVPWADARRVLLRR